MFSDKKKRIIPDLTFATADRLVQKNCQKVLSDELKSQSVDQIISKLLSFQGNFLSSKDLSSSSSSNCSLKET
jgi:outer membrane lipopolysaccharide assembly protein LptE/RlpB